jgi:hypothetical protein
MPEETRERPQAENFGDLLKRDGDVVAFTPITQPAPQPSPSPSPPISADETFAAVLKPWTAKSHPCAKQVTQAGRDWLTAKGL